MSDFVPIEHGSANSGVKLYEDVDGERLSLLSVLKTLTLKSYSSQEVN